VRTLAEWLELEIKKRGLSNSEFARQSGVAKTTINNILNKRGGHPHIDTLIALSKYTGTSVHSLFSLVVGVDTVNAQAYILAQRIMELSSDKQELLMGLLTGVSLQQANGSRK